MTTMKFSSLGGFAAHLLTIEADLEPAGGVRRKGVPHGRERGQDGDWHLPL
jgi:hypothetical protein